MLNLELADVQFSNAAVPPDFSVGSGELEVCQCEHGLNSTIQIVVIHSVLRNRRDVETFVADGHRARFAHVPRRVLA
jgi:hypothetical protein